MKYLFALEISTDQKEHDPLVNATRRIIRIIERRNYTITALSLPEALALLTQKLLRNK